MKVQFVAQSSRMDDNPGLTGERLINLYPEAAASGARSPWLLRSVLGYEETAFGDLDNKVVRAARQVGDKVFVVASGRLYEVDDAGAETDRGAIEDDAATTISDNNGSVTIAAGSNYYVWDGATLSTPGSGAFSDEGSVAFIDQYTVISQKDGRLVEWTPLATPGTRSALNVKTKEGRTDNVVRVVAASGYIYVLGERSTEIWANTGQANAAAFQRLPGAVIDQGVKAANLADEFEDQLFMVGEDNVAYVSAGGAFQVISTAAVNYALEQETPTNTFFYEDRGHKFWCVRFADRPAWCYDLATGIWHERASGIGANAWDVVATVFAFGKWLALSRLGEIREMARTNKDGANVLRREATSLPLEQDGEFFSVDALEFRVMNGFSDLGRDVAIMAAKSTDGGATFGLERTTNIGRQGQYGLRGRFRSWGTQRQFTARVAMTDAIETPIEASALVEIS